MRRHGLTGELIPENEAERTDPRYLRQQAEKKAAEEQRRADRLYGRRDDVTASLRDLRDDSADEATSDFMQSVVRSELRKREAADPEAQRRQLIDWLKSDDE